MENTGEKFALAAVMEELMSSIPGLIPQFSVDCVIFGFHGSELKVLLSKFHNLDIWALHGGFIGQDEDMDAAAHRTLCDHTGLTGIYLEQFHVFGKADRQTYRFMETIFEDQPVPPALEHFFNKRFISVGYFALVDFSKVNPVSALVFEKSAWFDVHELPEMAFDHADIIKKALEHLRRSLDYKLVGFNLMPECFTMNELQRLYETILGEKFQRANFQRKMLDMRLLERLATKQTGKGHKAPFLYRFKT